MSTPSPHREFQSDHQKLIFHSQCPAHKTFLELVTVLFNVSMTLTAKTCRNAAKMGVVELSAWEENDACKSQIVRYVWLMCVILCSRMVQVCRSVLHIRILMMLPIVSMNHCPTYMYRLCFVLLWTALMQLSLKESAAQCVHPLCLQNVL